MTICNGMGMASSTASVARDVNLPHPMWHCTIRRERDLRIRLRTGRPDAGFGIRSVESQTVQDSPSREQAKGELMARALRRRAHMVDSSDKMHNGGGLVALHAFADMTGCRPRWGSSQSAYSTYNLAIASSK